MSRRLLVVLFAVALVAVPLRAQIVVIDPANLTQTILIQERAYQQLDQLRREFEVIQRMAQKLGSLDGYRIPPIFVTSHDPSLFDYGRPWIQALNTGDARGTAYYQTALPLERPRAADLSRLTSEARRTFESQYATMEITDSVAQIGAHQVALVRNYFGKLQDATQNLENDLVSTETGTHELTAVLDKVAAGELLGRRQDTAANQLLSHALEQLLARSKRLRDTEAGNVNMQLLMWRDGLVDSKRSRDTEASLMNMQLTTWRIAGAANAAFGAGTGDALRTWRQP